MADKTFKTGRRKSNSSTASSTKVGNQRDHKQDDENKKQQFRNTSGCESNSTKTEDPGDYRDQQEYKRPIKHGASLNM
jgi:hypothetical protein